MTIRVFGIVLEVRVWSLFVRVPKFGELFWSPNLGLTCSRI